MFKNVAAKFRVFAFNITTGAPVSGDAANLTAYVSKDYGAVTVLADTSATEEEATNAKGYYLFDAAQAETNADCLMVSAKSSTANISVIGAPAVIYTRPTTGWLAPATAGRTLVVDAAGLADANMVKAGPSGSGAAVAAGAIPNAVAGALGGVFIAGTNHSCNILFGLTVANSIIITTGGFSAPTIQTAGGSFSVNFGEVLSQLYAMIEQGDNSPAQWRFNDTALELATNDLDTVLARLTSARAGYLDNLNVGGPVASSAEVTSVQNNTRVVRVVPSIIERPEANSPSSPTVFRIELLLYDTVGNMEAPDSAPTVDIVNQAGTSLNARLSSTTMSLVSTGRYRVTYTATDSDPLEQLIWAFSVVEGGNTRVYGNTSLVVDTTAVDFTAADRTKLDTLHDTRIPGVIQPQTGDAFARIGSNGVGLSNIPWNASWDAEVQSEVADALGVYDPPTRAEATSDANSILAALGDVPTNAELAAALVALLKLDWTGITGEGDRSMLNALRFIRNRWNTTATPGTLTVYKEDDSTPAWTAPVSTDAGGLPITGIDPVGP